MYSKALESISEFGFVDPITVVQTNKNSYTIVDGEHRWKAARDLGYTQVPVSILVGLDPKDIPKLTIVLNELKGQSDPTKLADVLGDLLQGSTTEDLLKGLPYTEDVLKGYLGFRDLKLPASLPSAKPTPSGETQKEAWVERLFRVPQSISYLLDDAITKAKQDTFLETGETVSDASALERILAEYMAG